VLSTWQRGQEIVTRARTEAEGPLRPFVNRLAHSEPPLVRTKGTAVFLNRGKETTPLAMRANCVHNHVLHEHVIIMAIDTLPVPRVPESERTELDDLGYGDDGIVHVTAYFGYMEAPDVLGVLRLLTPKQTEGRIDVEGASYFLSDIELTTGSAKNMAQWRKHLFIATSHITADAANYFGLPPDRTVVMGSRIEV
jgi:KUP system potassium uptake protein